MEQTIETQKQETAGQKLAEDFMGTYSGKREHLMSQLAGNPDCWGVKEAARREDLMASMKESLWQRAVKIADEVEKFHEEIKANLRTEAQPEGLLREGLEAYGVTV